MKQQLESLRLDVKPRETPPGPRMVLPSHLSELLELTLPEQVLLIDLRSPTEFERSHIHGAANLRAPSMFLREAPLEAIEEAFTDDRSRRAFQGWQVARCIFFYARALETPRECPAAEILPERLAARGWWGDVYLLKGHYREFSTSFGRHIGGARMSDEGRDYANSLRNRTVSKEDVIKSEAEYSGWREAREAEGLGTGPYPPLDEEKKEVMERHEEELELAFRGKSPGYTPGHKARDDISDAKAQMVPYLDRGLTKIREGTHGSLSTPQRAPGHEKVTEGHMDERRSNSEEFVEVTKEVQEAMGAGEQKGEKAGGLINRVFRRA